MAITDPRDISGLVAWYSADAVTGYTDGQEITSWADQSGNGNHATAFTVGSAKPLFKTTGGPSGGAKRIRFQNGGYLKLPSGVLASATAGEIMAMTKSDYTNSTDQGFWHFGSDGASSNHYPYTSSIYDDWGRTSRVTVGATAENIAAWHRITVWSATNDWAFYINGNAQATSASSTVGFKTVPQIGNSGVTPSNATTDTFEGDHSVIVIYNRKLTSGERADLVTWMAANPSGGTPPASTTVTGGLATETDSALTGTVTVNARVNGGLTTETDSALTGSVKTGALIVGGLAAETDSALPATTINATLVSGGFATETDAALAGTLTIGSVILGGLAAETDIALTGTAILPQFISGGLATETDTALAGAIVDTDIYYGGLPLETDTALGGTVTLSYGTTDTTNLLGGRVRSGYATFTWTPPVVDPTEAIIGPLAYDYEKAHAFTAPTVSGGRVVPYSPAVVATPRHRDRILVGGTDVTFWRGVHTPTPSYRLVEPLLYGAGTLVLPQFNPLFEERPSWLRPGKPVKVQRVDPDTNEVIATDYSGFITAFSIDGGDLTCDLGGEVTGRMALKQQQIPVFKSVLPLERMLYDSVVANSPRPYTPRLGTPTGINLAKFGGLNKLDHFNQLCALGTQVDGDQWTVGLKDNGTWGNYLKDRETIDFTIYFDDARIPTSLNRDISEEPNRVYATAVAPDGHKIDFRVYPGLKQGEAPDYPMTGGGSFGIGTEDADTDTGSGITSMINRLIVMGYLTRADGADYIFDDDVADAIKKLQSDAGLTESGNMNQNTWAALYDLSATGYSLAGATTLPAAQRSSVRQWNRTSSGALASRNPNFDPHKIVVDAQYDMGVGFTTQQVRKWARNELGPEDNWVGTATLHFTVIRGEHTPGDPIDASDVMPAREIKPGMNGWAPLFDGGTLFHVSGVEVPAGGRAPVLTLDTRARDTMKAWEVIQRNRDSRRDPARVWLNQYRSSKVIKDGLGTWDKVGGIIDDRVALAGGEWTVFPVVAGQEGTIRRLRIRTNPNREFCAAVFGRKVSARRLNHLMPAPLSEGGNKWTKEWIQGWLEDRVYLDSWGDFDQPAGYSPGAKSDDDPLTGNLYDDAQLSYRTFAEPVLWVAVWAAGDCVIPPGRIMWQQLEEGS